MNALLGTDLTGSKVTNKDILAFFKLVRVRYPGIAKDAKEWKEGWPDFSGMLDEIITRLEKLEADKK